MAFLPRVANLRNAKSPTMKHFGCVGSPRTPYMMERKKSGDLGIHEKAFFVPTKNSKYAMFPKAMPLPPLKKSHS